MRGRKSLAFERFRRWLAAQPTTQSAVAAELGYSGSYLSLVKTGRKRPGLELACAIERITAHWVDGPIRAAEWSRTASTARPRKGRAA